MKVKTITEEFWSELYIKPFIFLGFHPYGLKLAAIAIYEEGICEFCVIDNTHEARQGFFKKIREKYAGAPIAVLNQKTEGFFANLLMGKNGKMTPLNIFLKGQQTSLARWKKEIECAFFGKNEAKNSEDNPIQFSDM